MTAAPAQTAAAPALTVSRPEHDDAVTALRREVKFDVSHADLRALALVLETNCRPVTFGAPVSHVHSLYFDDAAARSLREHWAGAAQRVKLRLRWYDAPRPGTRAFFELKRRDGPLVRKQRYEVRAGHPLGGLSFRDLVRGLAAALPPDLHEFATRHEPTVLIRYRRRHYRARDPRCEVRFTLDEAIECVNQRGRAALTLLFPAPLTGRVVLEAKFPDGAEEQALRLLAPLRPRPGRFSKFVHACALFGFLAELGEPALE